MASSKAFLLLGLVLVVVFMISSEVSATETAQTQETVKPNVVEAANGKQLDWHGFRHRHHHHKPGHGHPGHGAAGEEVEVKN